LTKYYTVNSVFGYSYQLLAEPEYRPLSYP